MLAANSELLDQTLQSYGIVPRPGALQGIIRHLEMVVEWNERVNLTAITAEREMVIKHAADSATATLMLDLHGNQNLLDVGTGAGFPGITLKCLFPDLRVALMDSLAKRCRFLAAVGEEIGLGSGDSDAGYEVVWGRAEEKGQLNEFRERFDIVVARAVAELRVLAEYCLPFCRVGGCFLAMKGPGGAEELGAAERAIAVLGGEVAEVRTVTLPDQAGSRSLILIRKVSVSPKEYPRKAGTPAKSPL